METVLLAMLNFGLGILNAVMAVTTNNLFSAGAAGFCIAIGMVELMIDLFLIESDPPGDGR